MNLDEVVRMANYQVRLEELIVDSESALAALKDELRQLQQVDFPLAMAEAGTNSLTLDNGFKIDLKDEIICGIPELERERAYAWLEKHEYGSIIKTKVITEYGKGELTNAQQLLIDLTKKKLNVVLIRDVHFQTLKAFLREQFADVKLAKRLPKELFGASLFQKTKVTAPKPKS